MIKNILIFLFLSVLIAVEATAQTGGGFPSRPTFQSVIAKEKITLQPTVANNAILIMNDSTASPYQFITGNAGDWSLRACSENLSSCANVINFPTRASDTTVSNVDFTVTQNVRINGNNIATNITGTYTGTYVGCTTSPTVTVTYAKVGNIVSLRFFGPGSGTCTSNSANFTLTGAPAAIIPTNATGFQAVSPGCLDNGAFISNCQLVMNNAGTINIDKDAAQGWTASGSKGLNCSTTLSCTNPTTLTYTLN